MPDFPLGGLAGFEGTLSLPQGATNEPVSIRLTDALIYLPQGQTLPLLATVTSNAAGGTTKVELRSNFASPPILVGGQLRLDDLTVVITFASGSTTAPLAPIAGVSPIVATGTVSWIGGAPLGLSGGIPLELGYEWLSAGASGFTLNLKHPPLAIPGGLASIGQGRLRIELRPQTPSVVIALSGSASLTASGAAQAGQLLSKIIPNAPQLKPLSFSFQREFALVDGAVDASAPEIGRPRFQFDFDWDAPSLPSLTGLQQLAGKLDLSIGKPSLTLPLDGTAAGWTLRLRDCAIRFPAFQGLEALSLQGLLTLDTSGTANRLLFRPTHGGALQLPDVLRLFLSRLTWDIGDGIPLDDVAEAAGMSQKDWDWSRFFANIVPDPLPSTSVDLSQFAADVKAALDAALSDLSLTLERAFFLAFSGIGAPSDDVLGVVWDDWFSRLPAMGLDPIARLPDLILTLDDLPAATRHPILLSLMSREFSLPDLCDSFLGSWADSFSTDFDRYLLGWLHTVGAAMDGLPAPRLAGFTDAMLGSLSSPSLPSMAVPRNPLDFDLPEYGGFDTPELPTGAIILASTTRGRRRGGAAPTTSTSVTVDEFLNEWRRFFNRPGDRQPDLTIEQLGKLLCSLVEQVNALVGDDRSRAETLLMMAVANKYVGVLAALAYLPVVVSRSLQVWTNLWHRQIERDPAWKVKTLPRPGTLRPGQVGMPASDPNKLAPRDRHYVKYLIFSDLHRDAASDAKKMFEIGAIDHFSRNAKLYCDVLDWATQEGYTVIEAGDCEELWFVRPDEKPAGWPDRPLNKLKEIIATHSGGGANVYARLANLYADRRYWRLVGNHDSYLRHSSAMLAELQKVIPQTTNPEPLAVYDAFIIDGVKSMTEHSWLDVLQTAVAAPTTPISATLDALLRGRLGMDARDYTDRCRMLVMHGHQFDVWNCPQNELAGMLIANTVGTFVDANMDPFLDLRGIAMGGNPLLDIAQQFASWPILSNWPARQESIALAHRVQHMPDGRRQLVDDMFFKETLATFFGCFGLMLDYVDAAGNKLTPAASAGALNLQNPFDLYEFLRRHHGHHLCIGHTHNPHSQPYVRVSNITGLIPLLGPILATLHQKIRDVVGGVANAALGPFGGLAEALVRAVLDPGLKTSYFNSGTGGWMEGVIWAIEIDATGQARLVYWSDRSDVKRGPEEMDWELTALDEATKKQLVASAPKVIPNLAGQLLPDFGQILAGLDKVAAKFRLAASEIAAAAPHFAAPYFALALAIARGGSDEGSRDEVELDEVGRDAGPGLEDFMRQSEHLHRFVLDVLTTLRGRLLGKQNVATQHFSVSAPLPAAMRARFERLRELLLVLQSATEVNADHMAGVALGTFDSFPRNWPFFGGAGGVERAARHLHDSLEPAAKALLTILPFFPAPGTQVAIEGLPKSDGTPRMQYLSSKLELAGDGRLRLSVRISDTKSTTGYV